MWTRAILVAAAVILTGCSSTPPTEKKAAEAPPVTKVDPATAARITGKVRFSGKRPQRKPISMESEEDCRKMHSKTVLNEDVIIGPGGGVGNVFVHIKTGLEGKTFALVKIPVKLDQKGCMFKPRVIGVMTGQTLEIHNSDHVTHNVHPSPRENREWNQGQPAGAPPLEREFARRELMIPVKCNVHAWMRSYINVLPHPYFAVTKEDGMFEIKNLPPGEYTVEARHERFPAVEQKLTLVASGTGTVEFTFKGE